MHLQKYKYNLLSLFLLLVCILFQDWQLCIEPQYRGLSLGESKFFSQKSLVVYLWVRPHENFPFHISMSIDIAIDLSLLMPYLERLTGYILLVWLLYNFHSPFISVPWAIDVRTMVYMYSMEEGYTWPVVLCTISICSFLWWSPFAGKICSFDKGW